jgi:hypothetical protein
MTAVGHRSDPYCERAAAHEFGFARPSGTRHPVVRLLRSHLPANRPSPPCHEGGSRRRAISGAPELRFGRGSKLRRGRLRASASRGCGSGPAPEGARRPSDGRFVRFVQSEAVDPSPRSRCRLLPLGNSDEGGRGPSEGPAVARRRKEVGSLPRTAWVRRARLLSARPGHPKRRTDHRQVRGGRG